MPFIFDFKYTDAFSFGFLSNVIQADHIACGRRLEHVSACLDHLADEIHPSVFLVLRDTLSRLRDMRSAFFPDEDEDDYGVAGSLLPVWLREEQIARARRDPDYHLSFASRAKLEDAYFNKKTISEDDLYRSAKFVRAREWSSLSSGFFVAALRAIPDESAYRPYFACGRHLADCSNACELSDTVPTSLGKKIRNFQLASGQLTSQAELPWLKTLAQPGLAEKGIYDLDALLPKPFEFNRADPEIENWRRLFSYLYTYIQNEIQSPAITTQHKEERKSSEVALELPTPANIFRKAGRDWTFRYDGGEPFPMRDLVGLFYIAYLIEKNGKTIQAEDLWDAHPKHASDSAHRTVRGAAQAASSSPDASDSGGGATEGHVMSKAALRNIYNRLTAIKGELAQARKNSDESAEKALEREQKMLFKQVRAAMTPGGALRVFDQAHKKRHNAVRKAIMEAIEAIRISDARLGLHLKQSIPLDRPFFQYEPADPIPWSL